MRAAAGHRALRAGLGGSRLRRARRSPPAERAAPPRHRQRRLGRGSKCAAPITNTRRTSPWDGTLAPAECPRGEAAADVHEGGRSHAARRLQRWTARWAAAATRRALRRAPLRLRVRAAGADERARSASNGASVRTRTADALSTAAADPPPGAARLERSAAPTPTRPKTSSCRCGTLSASAGARRRSAARRRGVSTAWPDEPLGRKSTTCRSRAKRIVLQDGAASLARRARGIVREQHWGSASTGLDVGRQERGSETGRDVRRPPTLRRAGCRALAVLERRPGGAHDAMGHSRPACRLYFSESSAGRGRRRTRRSSPPCARRAWRRGHARGEGTASRRLLPVAPPQVGAPSAPGYRWAPPPQRRGLPAAADRHAAATARARRRHRRRRRRAKTRRARPRHERRDDGDAPLVTAALSGTRAGGGA